MDDIQISSPAPSILCADIHNTDIMDYLATLPDESVDLIIADPPYNIGIDGGASKHWDARRPEQEWIDWCVS